MVKPESGVFPDTDKAKHLVASGGGSGKLMVITCVGAPIWQHKSRSTGGSHRQENGEGGVTREERVVQVLQQRE